DDFPTILHTSCTIRTLRLRERAAASRGGRTAGRRPRRPFGEDPRRHRRRAPRPARRRPAPPDRAGDRGPGRGIAPLRLRPLRRPGGSLLRRRQTTLRAHRTDARPGTRDRRTVGARRRARASADPPLRAGRRGRAGDAAARRPISPVGIVALALAAIPFVVRDFRGRAAVLPAVPLLLMYALADAMWHPPMSFVLEGVIAGLLTSLLAAGIVIVYRANRIVNFAQAELGALPANFALPLIAARHWHY